MAVSSNVKSHRDLPKPILTCIPNNYFECTAAKENWVLFGCMLTQEGYNNQTFFWLQLFSFNYFNIRQLYSILVLLYKYGDKYTGQWDGYKGQGEINYKDGTKYKGQWESDYYWYCKRHGVGTLYSADGQVLNQGKWDKDKYKGNE